MASYSNNDRKMNRSVVQAMYRYLPGKWIDFYLKNSRRSYSAFVLNWNSEKLENTNIDRIKRAVWERLSAFPGFTKGYAPLHDDSAWSVMTPKVNDKNSAVIANISPLLFFCSNPHCRKTRQFRNSSEYLRDPRNSKCKFCGSQLTQVRLIYYCECGWAAPVFIPYCSCKAPIIQKSTYNYVCSKCGKEFELRTKCKDCGKLLYPKNALDNAQFYPKSLNIIDLVDLKRERFITQDENGQYLAIAYWLGFLPRKRLDTIVDQGLYKNDVETVEEQIQQRVKILKSDVPGMPEDFYRSLAIKLLDEADSPIRDVNTAVKKARSLIHSMGKEFLYSTAISILEYDSVVYSEEVRTIEEASSIAEELNTINDRSLYDTTAEKFHFSQVQASGRVPFVTAVYGFTRKNNTVAEKGTNICAFSRENEARSNIYATRMETEGVLFEFDRRTVLKWLILNNIVSSSEYCETMGDDELKAWFICNCNELNVPGYGPIDQELFPALSAVYKLIHTTSHAIIRQAAAISGLDKNSLSEYIFCNVPAVFIYCQNSQGFNLGALFSAFESQFNTWMETTKYETSQCIFDPVCINEKGACAGCLFLNDISCCHFNQDLDRRVLIGHQDVTTGDKFVGFWEI